MADMMLADIYRAYIACLNLQDWPALGDFVADDVTHNDRALGLAGYRDMLIRDFRDIPDLRFEIGLVVANDNHVAARLMFDCTPRGAFLGLPVDGRRIAFTENVFYRFNGRRIAAVWSVIDKQAVEAQLS